MAILACHTIRRLHPVACRQVKVRRCAEVSSSGSEQQWMQRRVRMNRSGPVGRVSSGGSQQGDESEQVKPGALAMSLSLVVFAIFRRHWHELR